MIVTDKGVAAAGLLNKIRSAMHDAKMQAGAVFDETPVDSSDKICNRVAGLFRDNGCDSLVAVGGGSVIDTAKGANIVISENTDDLLKFQGVDRIGARLKPLVVVPTTAGTGSEVTNVAVILNVGAGVKMALVSNRLYPTVAILDPVMTLSMPPLLTASTGMDALTHAIEAVYSLQANPVSTAFAAAAVTLLRNNIVEAVKNGGNETARMNMADGALLAGVAFSNAMVGCVHAMAHSIGAVAHVPHGVANSIMLPYGMEYNLAKAARSMAALAPLLSDENLEGLDDRARAVKAIEGVRKLTRELNGICGLPLRLGDAGVKELQLEQISRVAINDGALTYNPEEMTGKEALDTLIKAF
jgi:alcohol dehydrogenase